MFKGVVLLAAVSGVVLSSAGAASASTARGEAQYLPAAHCGTSTSPSVRGAKAHWQLSCSKGSVTVSGWVQDTKPDGKCAQVRADFPGGITVFSKRACPEGQKENFSWTYPGDLAEVYLLNT
jgi:hypothetical protein